MRKRPTGQLRRTGLHRCECADECGAYVYATVSALERHGLPVCPCGARLIPAALELAIALGVEDAPCVAEFHARVAQAWHGQTPNGPCDDSSRLRAPETVALEGTSKRPGLLAEWQAEIRKRQLSGLRRGPGTPVDPDPIPF